MPYLGNSPVSNFASVTKDTFSGDGSTTAFTLSKSATTNGVAVFVENVRQEPTTAYSVSGTTLTFTAAPVSASGNNIYVLHHNSPASTVTHPSAQALTATSGTFTGAFTSLGIDDNADATAITIDSAENIGIGTTPESHHANWTAIDFGDQGGLAHYDGGATSLSTNLYHDGSWKAKETGTSSRYEIGAGGTHNFYSGASASADAAVTLTNTLSIDANGHVTMPKQSSFLASFSTANTNIALNSAVHQYFDTEVYDINGDYASNTFTAPVTGKYFLQVRVRVDNIPTDAAYMWFYIQTSNRVHSIDFFDPDNFDGGGIYYTAQGSIVADMDASDTATFNIHQSGGTQQTDLISGFFSGHLLG